MKWLGRRESGNVEDRRGFSGGGMVVGGGIGVTIIYLIINFLFGGDAVNLSQSQTDPSPTTQNGVNATTNSSEDEMAHFAAVVLADNEDVWNKIFKKNGTTYSEPKMVLFNSQTQSACGYASSATGPFYCPGDQKLYLDLDFFNELKGRFGAGGDFANAYVIAHEVGHHVQYLMGTTDKVNRAQQNMSKKEANKLSVALELQADFYAGVWAHYNQEMKNVVEEGDIDEALNAANAIGDDRLQKMSTGTVAPDAFTHGTSQQRMYWFKLGYTSGDISKGNTFEELK